MITLEENVEKKYIEKWKQIQISTMETNKANAVKHIKEAYKVFNLKEPKKFLFVDSPTQGAIAYLTLCKKKKLVSPEEIKNIQKEQKYSPEEIRKQLGLMNPSKFEGYWLGFYDAVIQENVSLEDSDLSFEQIKPFIELAKEVTSYWATKNEVIIVENPVEVHVNERYDLHRDGDFAIRFKDGTGIYRFNGRSLPERYHKVVSSQWDPEWFIDEPNVEIKALILRQVGVERTLKFLNVKVIDKKEFKIPTNGKLVVHPYELITLDLTNNLKDRKYLKMSNPSTGTFHVEGVDNKCKTVQEAIDWRADEENWSPCELA